MSETRDIWTVSRLNQEARLLLEDHFPRLWLEGELLNFKSYSSGHWYFNLKDDKAQVRGVMFRGQNQRVRFRPADGQQVRVLAQVTLYDAQGSFQVQVLEMQEAGQGALLLQLEKLKQKLLAEGLFADQRKQPLPLLPRQIGVITSPSGAAFHDILNVLARRAPQLPVVLYPASVQGSAAPAELREALQLAVARHECDLLIIGRGGGSLEDLFCFNDEALVRAIAACPLPIISAVGHEVDFSLSDFAADVRAPTPSAAAELACPDLADWERQRAALANRLLQAITRQLARQRQQVAQWQQRLVSPERFLQFQQQRLDGISGRLDNAWQRDLRRHREHLHHLAQRLSACRPTLSLQHRQQRLADQQHRLVQQMRRQLDLGQTRLAPLLQRLQLAAPENLLKRGYSLTFLADSRTLVRGDAALPAGTRLVTRFAGDREVQSQVTK